MPDRLEQALDRLRSVASKAESEGRGMEILEIVKAILGPEVDEEILELVSIAMESTEGGMELEDMALGVMSLQEWRNQNT